MTSTMLLIAVTAAIAGEDRWEPLPALKTARQEVGVAALDGKIYVLGGILSSRAATGLVERYDIAEGEWEDVDPLPDDTRLHHIGAASVGGRVYSVGGLDSRFRGVRDVFAYDPSVERWSRVAPLPNARGGMGVAVLDGKIYAVGGQTGGTSFRFLSVYDPARNEWEELAPMATARNHLAAASAAGLVFAVSGRGGGLRPEVEAFDPSTGRWSPRAPILTPRAGIAAATFGGRIYVFGGEGNGSDPNGIFPQTESYDPVADEWTAHIDMAVPRHGIGAVTVGSRILIPGGSPREGFGVTDVHDAFVPGGARVAFLRGDANDDTSTDISDVVFILIRLFLEPGDFPCDDAADTNDDGDHDLADAVSVLEFLFRRGPPPPAPGPAVAGEDPTEDELGCGC